MLRKDILKLVRSKVQLNQCVMFSDKTNTFQKVKYYGVFEKTDKGINFLNTQQVNEKVKQINQLLQANNLLDFKAEIHADYRCLSIVMKIPYKYQ